MLGLTCARVVHDAEMHDGAQSALAKDFLGFLAPDIDLMMNDVFGFVLERSSIDSDDDALAMQSPSKPAAESSAYSSDEHWQIGEIARSVRSAWRTT
jgi:hypothetical protein